jgi:hypothetical protein
MRGAQRRTAKSLPTMVPSRRDQPSRPTLALATPPFLSVPDDKLRAPVPVEVRHGLTTSDRRPAKIEFQLGSCLDRLPLEEEEHGNAEAEAARWRRRGPGAHKSIPE